MGRQKAARKGPDGALGRSIMKDRKKAVKGAKGGDSWVWERTDRQLLRTAELCFDAFHFCI